MNYKDIQNLLHFARVCHGDGADGNVLRFRIVHDYRERQVYLDDALMLA